MGEWMGTALATYLGFGVIALGAAMVAVIGYVGARYVLCPLGDAKWEDLEAGEKAPVVMAVYVVVSLGFLLVTVLMLASQAVARGFGWLT